MHLWKYLFFCEGSVSIQLRLLRFQKQEDREWHIALLELVCQSRMNYVRRSVASLAPPTLVPMHGSHTYLLIGIKITTLEENLRRWDIDEIIKVSRTKGCVVTRVFVIQCLDELVNFCTVRGNYSHFPII